MQIQKRGFASSVRRCNCVKTDTTSTKHMLLRKVHRKWVFAIVSTFEEYMGRIRAPLVSHHTDLIPNSNQTPHCNLPIVKLSVISPPVDRIALSLENHAVLRGTFYHINK